MPCFCSFKLKKGTPHFVSLTFDTNVVPPSKGSYQVDAVH